MSSIQCVICKENKPINDCWCVIDSKTKERYYECKKKCNKPIQIEINIPSNMTVEEEQEEVHDIPQEPPKGLLERAIEWFGRSSNGYKKMKIE